MNRIRGNPLEKSALLPDLFGHILGESGNAQGCCTQRGLRFFQDPAKRQGIGLSGGLNAAEGPTIPAARVGDRLSRGSPLRAGHSPCRVRKSLPESMPVGARGGGDPA